MLSINKEIDMREANVACDAQRNCIECNEAYKGVFTPCNFIRNKYKESIWNHKEESRELEEYIKKYPEAMLIIGMTNTNSAYIRPASWAGCWNNRHELMSGRCLAYFDTKADAEKELQRIRKEMKE